jgi:hypothetical protein
MDLSLLANCKLPPHVSLSSPFSVESTMIHVITIVFVAIAITPTTIMVITSATTAKIGDVWR